MSRVYIDFESRSTVDIWEVGGWVYSIHPSTQVLCAAYAHEANQPEVLVDSFGALASLADDPNVTFVAHNSFFEYCIWENQMVKKHGLPRIPISRWMCTAAKAAAFGLPRSLDKCAKALDLDIKKDMGGRAIMLKLCKPRAARKGEDPSKVYWHESPDDYQKLYDYCVTDVEVERLVDKALPI
jgi:DNA polymerase